MRGAKLVLTVVLFPVIACGGSGDGGTNPPPPGPVTSVTLNKSSVLLRPAETATISATARDANGTTLSGKTFSWNNSNSTVASVTSSGSVATVTGSVLGTTSISATVDQVTSTAASITVTNSFPASANVSVGAGGANAFDPSTVDISAGGTVSFTWGSAVTHNVTFDNSAIAGSGDKSSGTFTATFTQSGTYNYHCTIHSGMSGVVTVH
ncbi:MAG TPA: plastocyanin/azurin family copper-binding protein [Gemmatimonadaceae bacterium]|nr:plastocyanin/azurin family copper-binding protein [Gemmatimonadaceae bacterium]